VKPALFYAAPVAVLAALLGTLYWVTVTVEDQRREKAQQAKQLHVLQQQQFYFCQGLVKDLRLVERFTRQDMKLSPSARGRYWSDVKYCVPSATIEPEDLIYEKAEYKLPTWIELLVKAGYGQPTFEAYQQWSHT
jgi:hypothetical protein